MSEVIGSVQVVVRPDTTNFAKDARKKIEKQFKRKNALELDFEVDPNQILRDVEDSRDAAQKWLNLKKNALKVTTTLSWSKRDLLSQLRNFKADVEALEKLQRPTVYANFEVDRKGLEEIRKDIKLNVELDAKTLQRSIKKATEDITIFGDPKELKKKTESAAKLSSQVFQDILTKKRLRIEIDADTEEIEKAQKAMEDALGRYAKSKGHLEGLEGSLAGVTKEMNRQANLVNRLTLEWKELESSGELNARQLSSYANSLREAEDALADMVRHERRIREERDRYSNNIFSPSLDGAKRLQREFEELERQLDDKKVEISAVAERSSFLAVAAELNALARDRMVLFWARVQKLGMGQISRQFQTISKASGEAATNVAKWIGQLTGVRVLWRTFRDMVDWLPRLDMMVPQLAQNLALITSAASGAVGAAGVLFTLLSDIGEVGKLVLAAPAGVAALGLQIWMLAAAYKEYEAHVPEIAADLDALTHAVTDGVWETATDNIRALHRSLMPLLDLHMPAWARVLGDNVGALADGFREATEAGVVEEFFKNAIKGSENATKGFKGLGSAMLRLAGAGSKVLPDLGTWFSKTMTNFDAWVTENTENGNIERWIREGATALSELGSIGVSTVKIIAGIADAFNAAGWPGLTEAERAMRSLGDAALGLKNNDSFMQTLEQVRYFFEEMEWLGPRASIAIKNAWGMIGSAAETLARPISLAIGGILDGFNSSKFQDGFGTFLTGLGSFITDVTPGLEVMTAEIGSLLGVVGTAGKSWGPAFNDMLLLFSSAGDKLHPGLIDFIENTGPDLQQLVRDITPHVEDFAEAISNLLGNENFQELIGDLIGDIGTLAGELLDLGTWVLDVANKFSDWYGTLSEGEQDFVRWTGIIVGFAGGALTLLGGAVLKIMGLFKKLGSIFKFLKFDKLLGALKGSKLGQAVGGFFKNIADDIALRALYFWDKIKGVGTRIGGVFRSVADDIALRALYFWDKLKGVGARIGGVFKGVADDIALRAMYLWDGIKGVGTRIGGALKGLFGKIKLPKLGNLTGGIGKMFAPLINVFKGLPGKLMRLLPKAGSIFKGLAPRILKVIGGPLGWLLLLRDAVNLIKPVGVLEFVEMILDKLGLGDSWFADVIGGFKENIEKAFGKDVGLFDLINPLSNMITKAWDGMVEGFDEGGLWGAIKGFFSGLGEGFLDHFQFAWENLKSVIGSFAPQGVIDFFDDPWGTIKGWIFGKDGDITAAMAPTQDHLVADMDFSKGLEGAIPKALQGAWDKVIGFFMKWSPAGIAFRIGSWIGEKIKGWLGIEGGIDLPDLGELAAWGTDFWNNKVLPKLQGGWDGLLGFFMKWSPIGIGFRIGSWLGEKIKGWLGVEGDGGLDLPDIGELAAWGTDLWNDKIKPKLQGGWDALLGFIKKWNPISAGFRFGKWIGGKIKEWLGIEGDGGVNLSDFSISFDFSSLWENKIKPALKTGLLVLGGLIAAPGLILIAPLALPALIIGWLLGRDGEGNWSFEELTNKLTGAWDKIKGALESGVKAIGGFIGGLVMSPVILGKTVAGWIMGDNWISDTVSALGNAFTGAGPALGGAIAEGVKSIRSAAEGAGAGKTGPGFMQRLLGVDGPQRGKIKVDFDTVRGFASNFTGGVSGDYSGMSVRTRDHLEHMNRKTKSSFGSMKSTASSDASSMQSKVVGEASKMQSLAAAKTAVMAKEIAQHTSRANTQAVAHATAMQAQYVKQVISMQMQALRYAALIASRMPGVLRVNLMPAGSYTGGTFVSGLASGLNRAHSVARGMANSIRSALRINAFSSGSAVGNTFASGLRSRASIVSSAARALASAARTKLPNSPAKEGPFAGSGWGGWGESIAEELARGMRKGAPAVAIEASRMMAAAAAELGNTARIDVAPDMRTVRTALGTPGATGGQAPITNVNVNVESRSEDPLQDGNRFGGDIAFALRGAGLA